MEFINIKGIAIISIEFIEQSHSVQSAVLEYILQFLNIMHRTRIYLFIRLISTNLSSSLFDLLIEFSKANRIAIISIKGIKQFLSQFSVYFFSDLLDQKLKFIKSEFSTLVNINDIKQFFDRDILLDHLSSQLDYQFIHLITEIAHFLSIAKAIIKKRVQVDIHP